MKIGKLHMVIMIGVRISLSSTPVITHTKLFTRMLLEKWARENKSMTSSYHSGDQA